MMKNQWLKVLQKVVNKPEKTMSRGTTVQVMLSPYDVPSEVRSYADESGDCIIEFKYLASSEKLQEKDSVNGVSLTVGRKTHRVYKIRIDRQYVLDNFDGQIALQLMMRAGESLWGAEADKRYQGNKDAISNILRSEYSDRLALH